MFTWICPQCGREVSPSYTDCPDCVPAKPKEPTPQSAEPERTPEPVKASEPERPAAPPPSPPRRAEPLPDVRSVVKTVEPIIPPQPPPRRGLPTWLMTILFALGFAAVGAGAYFAMKNFNGDTGTGAAKSAAAPAQTARHADTGNPLLRQIELVGLRLTQTPAKKTEVKFLVVNHSGAEIGNISGTVHLMARTAKEGEAPVGSFPLSVPTIGPYESKEVTAVVDTQLKVYELPDWQNLDPQVQFTSP